MIGSVAAFVGPQEADITTEGAERTERSRRYQLACAMPGFFRGSYGAPLHQHAMADPAIRP